MVNGRNKTWEGGGKAILSEEKQKFLEDKGKKGCEFSKNKWSSGWQRKKKGSGR